MGNSQQGCRRSQNRPRTRRKAVLGTARGDGVEGQRPHGRPPEPSAWLIRFWILKGRDAYQHPSLLLVGWKGGKEKAFYLKSTLLCRKGYGIITTFGYYSHEKLLPASPAGNKSGKFRH